MGGRASVIQTFTVLKAQTITFAALSNRPLGAAPFALTAKASSNLPVTFVSNTNSACTVAVAEVTMVAIGTCSITASQSGNSVYGATSVTQTFTVLETQTITFGPLSELVAGSGPSALSATASSNLAVTFASNSKTICTVLGTNVTPIAGGTCSITASQAGDSTWAAAPPVIQTFTVLKAQTITFAALSNRAEGTAPFALTAKASSNLPVTFVSNNNSFCTVAGTEVTLVAAGTCSITASQSGNTVYGAAPSVTQTFTVLETQTITFNPLSELVAGSGPAALSATATSNLAVTFASNSKTICTVLGTNVTPIAGGTCSITASQAGDSTWAAAPPVIQTFTVLKAQTITFAALNNRPLGAPAFALTAKASSNLPVTFVSNTNSACTVAVAEVTMVAIGTCSITASQSGNSVYGAAPSVTQTFTVLETQTITFNPPATEVAGTGSFALSATATSNLAVAFASNSTTIYTVLGANVTPIAGGTCSITASQPGDSTWAAAPPVIQTFTVLKAQTITFAALSNRPLGAAPFALSAKASSNLPVTFVSNNNSFCTVAGTEVTLVAAGTCSLTASQSGNSVYGAAPSVTQTFTVLETQTITFDPLSNQVLGTGPFALSATATSNLAVAFGSNSKTICTVLGTSMTLVTSGTCSITASQPGDSTWAAAPPVTQTFVVGKKNVVAVETTSLPSGFVGIAYSATVTAAGGTTPYTFTATGLPAGLSISASGAITGIPATAATTTAAITVTDSTAGTHLTNTANLSITIKPALAITTTLLPTGFAGVAYSAAVVATGGTSPYSFTATGLPAGLSISTGGQITGSPTTAGTTTAAITATDSTSGTAQTNTANLSITINPALAITTTSLPTGFVGIAYNTTVTATGGTSPYTFTATGLPSGLSISAGGAITGNPKTAGTTTPTITATDSTPGTHLTNKANLSITINPALAITTTSLPGGFANVAYSATVLATGGTSPSTFTATGLPAGLSISTTGAITGSPTATGTTTAAITVTDSTTGTPLTKTADLSITIKPALAISTTSLPTGFVGVAYNTTVLATGGTSPYTFTATGLPAGLSISAGGQITGSPTTAGTTTAAITATDSTSGTAQTATANLSITINPALAITTTLLPLGFVNTAYSTTVTATGGTSPYTFTATGLPAGLSISTGGAITGSPTTAGTTTAAITATDSTPGTHLTKTANLSITISNLAIITTSLSSGVVAVPYSATVTAGGGTTPYTFTATGLPAGLSISTGGAITGTPTTAGTVTAAITVTDSTTGTPLTKTANLSITINPPLAISTTSLPLGTVNASYSANVTATGGTQPYNFSATGLPAGLSISSSGHINGTPTAVGMTSVSFTVTDNTNPIQTTNATLSITIAPPPLVITTVTLPSGIATNTYAATVAASGGTPPYSFSATGLPDGLSISTTGQISGTPTTPGTTTATVTVTDAASNPMQTANAMYSITIIPYAPSLSITNATLGQNLQVPVTVTFNQPTANTVIVNISSDNPDVLISGTPTAAGTSTLTVGTQGNPVNPSLSPSFVVYVQSQGQTNSGTADLTVQASGGYYTQGTSTVTVVPSGFVLSGPNGVGASFTANQGSTTPLSVSAEAMDSSGNLLGIEAVSSAVPSVTVSFNNSAPTIGTVPASVSIPAGTSRSTPNSGQLDNPGQHPDYSAGSDRFCHPGAERQRRYGDGSGRNHKHQYRYGGSGPGKLHQPFVASHAFKPRDAYYNQ